MAAQSSLDSTRADVWELVWQFKIKTVVLLCPLKEGKKVGALIDCGVHVQYMQCLLVQHCARFYRAINIEYCRKCATGFGLRTLAAMHSTHSCRSTMLTPHSTLIGT